MILINKLCIVCGAESEPLNPDDYFSKVYICPKCRYAILKMREFIETNDRMLNSL